MMMMMINLFRLQTLMPRRDGITTDGTSVALRWMEVTGVKNQMTRHTEREHEQQIMESRHTEDKMR